MVINSRNNFSNGDILLGGVRMVEYASYAEMRDGELRVHMSAHEWTRNFPQPELVQEDTNLNVCSRIHS